MSVKRLSRKSRSSFGAHQKITRNLKGKRRFRAYARRIIWSLPWYKEIEDDTETQIVQFAARTRTKRGLSKEAKKILIKSSDVRTEKERDDLIAILGHIYFYNRYPKKEYEQLILKTNFVSYGPGRVILKQGHMVNPQSRLYYIVNGHLSVDIATVNPITLVSTSETVKKLGPGDFFGEVSILFNDVRESSITTLTTVELLYITKEDFDAILKHSLEIEWSKVRDALNDLPYFFSDWKDVELRKCSIISKLRSFKCGDLILGDGFGKNKTAHFVVQGKCNVIQDFRVQIMDGKYKLKPYINANAESDQTSGKEVNNEDDTSTDSHLLQYETEIIYLQTCILTKGACFGVGEKREHRRFVSGNDSVCLLVPQYLLLAHKRFESYRQVLESRLFTESDLFDSFVYLRNRHQFYKKTLESVKKQGSKINNTTIWDVPHYYRVLSPQIGICKVPDYIVNSPRTRRFMGITEYKSEEVPVKIVNSKKIAE